MKKLIGLMAVALVGSATSQAAVQETREGYFAIQTVILVDLAPPAAYRALTRLPAWWDSAHTWSG